MTEFVLPLEFLWSCVHAWLVLDVIGILVLLYCIARAPVGPTRWD